MLQRITWDHYYGTANKNYHEYLMDDMVKYKKYFYMLRPILACKWIEEKKCPPPVLFNELFNSVLEDDMKSAVEELLAKKNFILKGGMLVASIVGVDMRATMDIDR